MNNSYLLFVLFAACAAQPNAEDSASTKRPATSTAQIPTPPSAGSRLVIVPPPGPSVARSSTPDWRSQVPCKADADCGWDDPCMPSLCGGHKSSTLKCSESMPPPGKCLCVADACTLKPDKIPAPTGTCEVRGCAVDRARGACVADTDGVPENIRTNRHVDSGPSCDCIDPKKGCTFQWFDPIPCKSEMDCWVAEDPRPHPVVRPKNLRRPFKPCKDGEIPPVCGPQGFCALGSGYKC